jgi:hypothetical protein
MRTILCAASALTIMAMGTHGAESDLLLQAVGFALTGSDNAKVQIIDRKNCVFRIGSYDVFHLNNVHVDRLVFEKSSFGIYDLTVELHGNTPVYEETGNIFKDAGFTLPAGVPDHIISNEHTLNLDTKEPDRVQRAWKYIYSHGCVGKKSPF